MNRTCKGIAVSLATVLLVLAGAEAALRASGYDPFGEYFANARLPWSVRLGIVRESDDELLVYELVPGTHARAWGTELRINSLGFRGPEIERQKAEGRVRVLALGDSVTIGLGLPSDSPWPRVLEDRLRAGGADAEVVNMGLGGYDTLQEVALLEKVGVELDPDQVVLAYHMNDLGYVSPLRGYVQRLQAYGAPLYRLRLLQAYRLAADRAEQSRQELRSDDTTSFERVFRGYIADLSHDHAALDTLASLRGVLESRPKKDLAEHRYLIWHASEARVGRLRWAFDRLGAMSREHDFDVLVFPVPWLGDCGWEAAYDLALEIVRYEVERQGFTWLNPLPATRPVGHSRLQIKPGDNGHPNAAGHVLLAEAVAELLGNSSSPALRPLTPPGSCAR